METSDYLKNLELKWLFIRKLFRNLKLPFILKWETGRKPLETNNFAVCFYTFFECYHVKKNLKIHLIENFIIDLYLRFGHFKPDKEQALKITQAANG